jgi:hypothetical protein
MLLFLRKMQKKMKEIGKGKQEKRVRTKREKIKLQK